MKHFLKQLLWFYVLLLIFSIAAAFLPFSTEVNVADRIFTFISAVTLTGAAMNGDLSGFSFSGQILTLIIIQLAAIWQLVFALSFAVLAGQKSLISNTNDIITSNKIIKKVIIYLLLCEAFSIVCIYAFTQNIPAKNQIFNAFFHGISVFSGSGFTLFKGGFSNAVFADAYIFKIVLAGLICIIATGFIVYFDLTNLKRLRNRMANPEINWTKHTRFSIYSLLIIILVGSIIFYLFEKSNILSGQKTVEAGISSIINIYGAGGSGISTYNIADLEKGTQFLMLLTMLTGVPGGSILGGLTLSAWSLFFMMIFKSKNNFQPLMKSALAIIIFSVFTIVFSSLLLKIIFPEQCFFNALFDSVSAFTNNGFSLGIYSDNHTAKIILSAVMLAGRFGVAAIAFFAYIRFAKNASTHEENNEIALL